MSDSKFNALVESTKESLVEEVGELVTLSGTLEARSKGQVIYLERTDVITDEKTSFSLDALEFKKLIKEYS